MANITILLVRHGETDWNTEHRTQGWKSNPLNESGVKQIQELAHACCSGCGKAGGQDWKYGGTFPNRPFRQPHLSDAAYSFGLCW